MLNVGALEPLKEVALVDAFAFDVTFPALDSHEKGVDLAVAMRSIFRRRYSNGRAQPN